MSRTYSRTLATLILTIGLVLTGCSPEQTPPQKKQTEVAVISMAPQAQTLTSELPGRTKAWMSAQIRPQVSGIVKQRLFTEGADVKAGEALYTLDPAPYQATYAQAKASAAQAKAALLSARLKASRFSELVKIDAISKQDNEDAQASLQSAEAIYQAAQASVDSARIDLNYTTITSPIAGRIEASSVTAGALVTASQDSVLTTVQQLDPLYVDITQSSAEVLRLKRELAAGTLVGATMDGVKIDLLLEDGSQYAHAGRLQFSGASVSESTGSVTLRAVVPNPDGLLLPGMYVRAVVTEAIDPQAMLVPQRAVTRSHSGATSVLVVVEGKVEQRLISIDRNVGNQWWVSAGLAAGDHVIVEGGQKVRIGDTVSSVAVQQSGSAAAVASN